MADIIERIQKLLALSNNAGSEAEAALAAERARDLMIEHNIAEAELRASGVGDVMSTEEIIESEAVADTKKKVAWHMRIAGAVDTLYGCHAFWWGSTIHFFGRLSAVRAAMYTTQYLMREVDRLTKNHIADGDFSRKYINGFRLGCAQRVRTNIEKIVEEREARETGEVTAETLTWDHVKELRKLASEDAGTIKIGTERIDADELLEICENTKSPHEHIRETARAACADLVNKQTVPNIFDDLFVEAAARNVKASDGALAVIKKDQEEVDEKYQDFLYGKKNPKTGKRKRRGRSVNIGQVSSSDGYHAGREAGRSIKINASRGGLPRGQDSLK